MEQCEQNPSVQNGKHENTAPPQVEEAVRSVFPWIKESSPLLSEFLFIWFCFSFQLKVKKVFSSLLNDFLLGSAPRRKLGER